MHNHNVFFWLKEGLPSNAFLEFEKGLETLTKAQQVISGYYGKPAKTSRDVVDNTYSYGLTLVFKNTKDHDLYQADPVHLVFVEKNSSKWAKVLVYDIETNINQ